MMGVVSPTGFFTALRMAALLWAAPALGAEPPPAAPDQRNGPPTSGGSPTVVPRMLLLDAARSGRDVIAVGERGTILRSTDHARTWQRVPSGTRATLTGISFAAGAEQSGWAVGHDAIILASTDGGRTWAKQFQGDDLQDSFLDVLAVDAQRVIAVGAYGLYLQTADGGKTWTRRKVIDDDAHLNRISRSGDGEICLAGEHGTLLLALNGGETWRPLRAPYDGSFYGLFSLGPPQRAGGLRSFLAYGLEGSAFRSSDEGVTWVRLENRESVLLATSLQLGGVLPPVFAGNSRALFSYTGTALVAAPRPIFRASVAELLELADGNVLAVGEAGAEVLSSSDWRPVRR